MTIPKQRKARKPKEKTPLKSAWILKNVKLASDLRSKEREFHGLEREFIGYQESLLSDYEKSKDLKHPRDMGDARESILQKFLQTSGCIPKKYGVSDISARVISPYGQSSKELDIVFYDTQNSISLMRRQGVYEAFPIESVHGVIQIKSKLTKDEIRNGLENISSFKKLRHSRGTQSQSSGFGILFAYDSDMEWKDIVNEIAQYAKTTDPNIWTNAIFILNQGTILHGTEKAGYISNQDIKKITDVKMYGQPDHTNGCLFTFYTVLMQLLSNTKSRWVNINEYFRLPLVAGDYSYRFAFGASSEIANCEKHGAVQKKFSEQNMSKIMSFAEMAEPINWIKATDIAYGRENENEEQYARQPTNVRIYNPENLALSAILLAETQIAEQIVFMLAYDDIDCEGMRVWIPHYYVYKENLYEPCKQCSKRKRK
jgi:hypothetical protein